MPWTNPETFTAGQTLTAASMNKISGNLTELQAGRTDAATPMLQVYRTTASASYSSNTNITWEAAGANTDSMWSSGATITINTAGLYMVTLRGIISCSAGLTIINTRLIAGEGTHRNYSPAATSTSGFAQSTFVGRFAASDTLSGRMQFTGGSSHNILGGALASESTTAMAVVWLGPA
jgi:hypothetical protein